MSAWTYSQSSGAMMDPDGNVVEVGYSGADQYVNQPLAESLEDRGPIPTGNYKIGDAYTHASCGPVSMPLEPDPENEMHDRSGFLIHGDTASQDFSASTGCIILSRTTREAIDASECRDLIVTV